jgi:hypothetical protein
MLAFHFGLYWTSACGWDRSEQPLTIQLIHTFAILVALVQYVLVVAIQQAPMANQAARFTAAVTAIPTEACIDAS